MRKFIDNTYGDAVVEATVLFPIMILIFAGLVLLAVYLPIRSALQHATQYAATAIATGWSDTWLFFDESSMSYYWEDSIDQLENVYVSLFSAKQDPEPVAQDIVAEIESRAISAKSGELTVTSHYGNYLIYREVVVTAVREFGIPVNLSFVRFPDSLTITASSTAVVQDGDEFVRNADMASDFVEFIKDKFGLSDLSDAIGSFGSRIAPYLGYR